MADDELPVENSSRVTEKKFKFTPLFFVTVIFSLLAVALTNYLVTSIPILEYKIPGGATPGSFDGQTFFFRWRYDYSYYWLDAIIPNYGFYLLIALIIISLIVSSGLLIKSFREYKLLTFINWGIYLLVFIGFAIIYYAYETAVQEYCLIQERLMFALPFYPFFVNLPMQVHLLLEKKSPREWFTHHTNSFDSHTKTNLHRTFVGFVCFTYLLSLLIPFIYSFPVLSSEFILYFAILEGSYLLVFLAYYFSMGVSYVNQRAKIMKMEINEQLKTKNEPINRSLGKTSLTLSLIALIISILPYLGTIIGFLLNVSALIFGIHGLQMQHRKNLAIGGVILSTLGLFTPFIILAIVFVLVSGW